MANKRIIDLEDSSQLDLNDYIAVYNAESIADNPTYKERINNVLGLKTISVNGVSGNSITINADHISDTATTKKFVNTTEKNKIALIKTDLGSEVFLTGDGSYKAIVDPVDAILPAFSKSLMGYSLSGTTTSERVLNSVISVGTPISGDTLFSWVFCLPDKVQTNSIRILDVTNSNYIGTGLQTNNWNNYNAGYAVVDIGTIANDTPITHTWRIELTSTNGAVIQSSDLTIVSV